ncbi:hypothetical protein SO802_019271 [Lithocarpus litseifolius]|uniref:Late embryogenesis abundant protein LEA-2 subgroup domain-containing protein n=1 Tax=Lithocarpus litseifolius TaxID=425828 RepID=A0AAW2CNQ6_9ROSI
MSTRCRWFLCFLLFMVIACSITWVAVWCASYPNLPEFRVHSVSVSNFSYFDSNASVTGNWNVCFSVYNPNKKFSISYDVAQSSLLYEPKTSYLFYAPEFTSETRIPGFNQFARNRTFIDAAFASRDDYVDRGALGDINVDGTPGTITFKVMLVAGFKFEDARSGRVVDYETESLKVWCEGLVVSLSLSNRSASGSGKLVKPRNCEVSS